MTTKIDKLISELCPEGVEFKELGEVSLIKRGQRVTKNELSPEKKFPVYSGGVTPMGYFEKSNQSANTITIVKYGTAGFVNFITEDFWANDVCYCIKPKNSLINRYLFYFLKYKQGFIQSQATNAIPAHLPTEIISSIKIPLPPLPIQEEIVKILDNFTDLEAELEAELEARNKQYEHYREELLTFRDDVKCVPLSELCKIGDGLHGTPKYNPLGEYYFINGNNLKKGHLVFEENTKKVDDEMFNKHGIEFFENKTLFMSINGTIGSVAFFKNEKIVLGKSVAYFNLKSGSLNLSFLYYLLQTNFAKNYYEMQKTGATIKNLGLKALREFKIPLPPLHEQERIVAILDKFDALVNDISIGLPAELEARRKQYEYYREKLLTFKEVKA
jgi:type I restriction enzyme, S subunit